MSYEIRNRNCYSIGGLVFDAVDMGDTVEIIIEAIRNNQKLFLSTPNLNFLIASQKNKFFQKSVLESDLSIADGMPIVFLSKFLGLPIKTRVTGSGLIEALRENKKLKKKPLNVFFFGGMDGIAEKAHEILNNSADGLRSVGYLNPGFGTVEEMSSDEIIEEINSKNPDFIIVSLGAVKGQEWIMQNRHKLNANVISHLGAVVNFVAGNVQRAPKWVQNIHMEWMWRIKEEPALFSRYFKDGLSLIQLFFSKIIPNKFSLITEKGKPETSFEMNVKDEILSLSGNLKKEHVKLIDDKIAELSKNIEVIKIDVSKVKDIQNPVMAYIMLLSARYEAVHKKIQLINLPEGISKMIWWQNAKFLLCN